MSRSEPTLQPQFALANTLGVRSHAQFSCAVTSLTALAELTAHARRKRLPLHILGGASNVILLPEVRGLTLRIRLAGLALTWQGRFALLDVGAGENWQGVVRYSLSQGLCGLENLTLIPGTLGAAPVQNIGAYGAEVAEFLVGVHAVELATGRERYFSRDECHFGYRTSRFREEPGCWCITRVRLRLPRAAALRLDYQGIAEELERMGIARSRATAVDVAEAVTRIRRRKLPDMRRHPNVGSFFKNPLVSAEHYAVLQARHGALPGWSDGAGRVKLSAAALIDRAGWKQRGTRQVGVWRAQPLVLVNRGGADGAAVLAFAQHIIDDIAATYDVRLVREPLVIGGLLPGP